MEKFLHSINVAIVLVGVCLLGIGGAFISLSHDDSTIADKYALLLMATVVFVAGALTVVAGIGELLPVLKRK